MGERMQSLAEEWYAAWNAHDLDRILAHYSEEIVFVSPFVAKLRSNPEGRLVDDGGLVRETVAHYG